MSYGGPVQVTGGPGTGKTVAALHRVKHLLTRSPDARVLLTTYTNALAASLRENLSFLLDQDPALLDRVDVTTVNAYAHGVVSRLDGKAPSDRGPGRASGVAARGQEARAPVDGAVPGAGVPACRPRSGPAKPGRLPRSRTPRPRQRPAVGAARAVVAGRRAVRLDAA